MSIFAGIASQQDIECKQTNGGAEYVGTMAVTETGKKCQRWDMQIPHKHSLNDASLFQEKALLPDLRNFCRNPNRAARLWCYTTDSSVVSEPCEVPMCGNINLVKYNFNPFLPILT